MHSSPYLYLDNIKSLNALLLDVPHGFTNVIMNGISMFLSYRYNEIGLVGALSSSVTFVGALLLLVLPQNGAKLAGLYLADNVVSNIIIQTYIANNVSGVSKKTLFTSVNLLGYTIGHFVGPLTMRQKDAPRYIPAVIAYMVASAFTLFLFLYLRQSYKRENKLRAKYLGNTQEEKPGALVGSKEDVTDKQNTFFVYKT